MEYVLANKKRLLCPGCLAQEDRDLRYLAESAEDRRDQLAEESIQAFEAFSRKHTACADSFPGLDDVDRHRLANARARA